MSGYEGIVKIYDYYHESFGWTLDQVDNTDLAYLIKLLKVRVITGPQEDEKLSTIDEVL